jgi:Tfp pilus assembly protein PilO
MQAKAPASVRAQYALGLPSQNSSRELSMAILLGGILGTAIDPFLSIPCLVIGYRSRSFQRAILFGIGWQTALFVLLLLLNSSNRELSGHWSAGSHYFFSLLAALLLVTLSFSARLMVRGKETATHETGEPQGNNLDHPVESGIPAIEDAANLTNETTPESIAVESPLTSEASATKRSETSPFLVAALIGIAFGPLGYAIAKGSSQKKIDHLEAEKFSLRNDLSRAHRQLALRTPLIGEATTTQQLASTSRELTAIARDLMLVPNNYTIDSTQLATHQGCISEVNSLSAFIHSAEAKRSEALNRIRILAARLD